MHRDDLPIPEPCSADWSAMEGGDAKRFCGSCTKHVHDLSAMTEDEARALLDGEPGLCVRYRVRRDGRVQFARRSPLVRAAWTAAVGATLFTTPAFAAATPSVEIDVLEVLTELIEEAIDLVDVPVPVMGAVVVDVEALEEAPPASDPTPPEPTVIPEVHAEPARTEIVQGDVAWEPRPLMGRPALPRKERQQRRR